MGRQGNNILSKRFTPLLVTRFALPNVVMMIFLSLYAIVDSMFISRFVGELALSATNMVYPIFGLQLAVGIMFGTGGSAVIACKLGENDPKRAKEDFTGLVVLSALVGILFTILCLPLLTPILHLLGTSPAQSTDAVAYAGTLLWFAPMILLQAVFQMFFVTAGKPRLGLVLTIVGGIVNMILDYLFMGPLGMGVAGAALATGIGYSIPAVVGLFYFSLARKGTLFFTSFRLRGRTVLRTISNGSSEMVSNVSESVTTLLFNLIFMKFLAEDGVAAITILYDFQFLCSAIFSGFSMGIAPVISFKYGADDQKQLKHIVRFGLLFILGCSVGVFLLSHLLIRPVLSVFTTPDSPVFAIAIKGFPVYSLQFLFMGVSLYASSLFTALNNGIASAIISLSRTFVFLVGSLLILPHFFGKPGIWMAVPAAEFAGCLLSAGFLIGEKHRYHY